MNNILTWKKGELNAQKYLKRQGYKIIETNAKNKLCEIDIIALKNDCLVFVEVKARENLDYGTPAEAVDIRRQKRYINFAKQYIVNNNYLDFHIRFDIIEILNGKINHIENAFQN